MIRTGGTGRRRGVARLISAGVAGLCVVTGLSLASPAAAAPATGPTVTGPTVTAPAGAAAAVPAAGTATAGHRPGPTAAPARTEQPYIRSSGWVTVAAGKSEEIDVSCAPGDRIVLDAGNNPVLLRTIAVAGAMKPVPPELVKFVSEPGQRYPGTGPDGMPWYRSAETSVSNAQDAQGVWVRYAVACVDQTITEIHLGSSGSFQAHPGGQNNPTVVNVRCEFGFHMVLADDGPDPTTPRLGLFDTENGYQVLGGDHNPAVLEYRGMATDPYLGRVGPTTYRGMEVQVYNYGPTNRAASFQWVCARSDRDRIRMEFGPMQVAQTVPQEKTVTCSTDGSAVLLTTLDGGMIRAELQDLRDQAHVSYAPEFRDQIPGTNLYRSVHIVMRSRDGYPHLAAGAVLCVSRTVPNTNNDAVVALGDSFISGEAGRWNGNSNGSTADRDGTDRAVPGGPEKVYGSTYANGCDRSDVAEVSADFAAAPRMNFINIACSGAETRNIIRAANGGQPRNGEPPQADQLVDVARQHRVRTIVLSIGGNDLGFGSIIKRCAGYFLINAPTCWQSEDKALEANLTPVADNVRKAIREVRAAMASAGYAPADYTFVLQSYPSPIPSGDRNRYPETYARATEGGCPFYNVDSSWARTTMVGRISLMLQTVAQGEQVTFLDLQNAFDKREVCAAGTRHASPDDPPAGTHSEWARFIAGATQGTVQESMHPNAYGQRALNRCLALLRALVPPASRSCRNTPGAGPEGMVLQPLTRRPGR